MIDLQKVSKQVKDDFLYNTILYDMQEVFGKDITYEQIEELLLSESKYIQEYKDINRYSELSSIQALELEISQNDEKSCSDVKKDINENVGKLKALENFSVDSTYSAYEIWIGSAGVMVIFMTHNIIALFSELYTTHGVYVYTSFAAILGLTFWGYIKIKKNHEKQHSLYNILYEKTQNIIDNAFSKHYITKTELYGNC
jgi:hypothetical protein